MIIESLLDTDLYKFTMMQVVLHHFPGAQVEYVFKCRTEGVDLAPHADEIRAGIADLCKLRFREDELAYLRGLRFMKSDFVDFLGLFQFNEKYIEVERGAGKPGGSRSSIRGPWLHTIMYEIPVLAIVSEVYFRRTQPRPDLDEGRRRLKAKIDQVRALEPALHLPRLGLRHAPALLARLARRGDRHLQARDARALRRHLQRLAGDAARRDAAGHHGARVHAGLPGARTAAARFAGLRLRRLGEGIPRRPRHRHFRHVWDRCIPA